MNEDNFNMAVRKFLKKVGVTAQREIEKAVREGMDSGTLKGDETLTARVRLVIDGLPLDVAIDGDIALD